LAKKRQDQVIVIDVESTCWEGLPPVGEESEIIEIGICTLDVASGQRLHKRGLLVKPEHSQVSEYCQQLTTLTQEQVDGGVSFAEACAVLRNEYLAKERVWASYGDYDRRQFERQCRARQMGYPFGLRHTNVKSLFALAQALPHEVSVPEALHMLNLPLEGVLHRGVDDAWNIAAILSTLLLRARAPG